MAGAGRNPWRIVLQGLITLVVAAILIALPTLARMALADALGSLSPFMLYVAAVLVAGLVRGSLCGGLVMLGGGILGLRLFLTHDGAVDPGGTISLMLFWGVSAPVLATANELRVQLSRAMARLSAALARSERPLS